MRSVTPLRLLLLALTLVVAFGCVVPSVFHDKWHRHGSSYSRNRLTGEVTKEQFAARPDFWYCMSPQRNSVFVIDD